MARKFSELRQKMSPAARYGAKRSPAVDAKPALIPARWPPASRQFQRALRLGGFTSVSEAGRVIPVRDGKSKKMKDQVGCRAEGALESQRRNSAMPSRPAPQKLRSAGSGTGVTEVMTSVS
jgi:hypothetical protein